MKVAGTGHRPDKLGGYGKDVRIKLKRVATKSLELLQPTEVMSGMALGWDTALAEAALELGIPLTAAVPFKGQEGRWPQESKDRYFYLLSQASSVVEVCPPGYAAWKMSKRNEYMNNWADAVLALFDTSVTSGGTWHCIQDGIRKKKRVENAWDIFTGQSDQLTVLKS